MAYVNVANWKPDEVAEWLKGLDSTVSSYIHSFMQNDINGQQLLNIQPDDLEQLGVLKIGHQEIILEAVELLKNFHYDLDRENLQLLGLRLSCLARSLHSELRTNQDSVVSTQVLADVANVVSAVKPLVCWLDRSPFSGQLSYIEKKNEFLKLSLEMAMSSQRDRFADKPVDYIRRSCEQLAELADSIVRDIDDSLLLQPASLDLATLKKRPGDHLGFYIVTSFHGIHQVGELKCNSAAHQSGKIETGDEIVQINYQTVVGWEVKEVMALFEESSTEILLTLKKRPRHSKVFGQIYIKPYRLPCKKQMSYSSKWNDLLTPPGAGLLTVPHFRLPVRINNPKPVITKSIESQASTKEPPPSPTPSAVSSSSNDSNEIEIMEDASSQDTRLYLPKPRIPVQRRATITGASPVNKSAPISLERFWHDLKLEREWRSSTVGKDKSNEQLRPSPPLPHGSLNWSAKLFEQAPEKKAASPTIVPDNPEMEAKGIVPLKQRIESLNKALEAQTTKPKLLPKPMVRTATGSDVLKFKCLPPAIPTPLSREPSPKTRGKLDKSLSTPSYDCTAEWREQQAFAFPEEKVMSAPGMSSEWPDTNDTSGGEYLILQDGQEAEDDSVFETKNETEPIEDAMKVPPKEVRVEEMNNVDANFAPVPAAKRIHTVINVPAIPRQRLETKKPIPAPPEPPPRPAKSPSLKLSHSGSSSSNKSHSKSSLKSPKGSRKKNPLLLKRRNISVKELGICDHEGWLFHRSRKVTGGSPLWIRGWFIIKGTIFYGFNSREATHARLMISLPGFTVSPAAEVKSRANSFKVYHTGTTFYFAAESREDLNGWVDSFSRVTISEEEQSIIMSETDGEEDDEPPKKNEKSSSTPMKKLSGLLFTGSSNYNGDKKNSLPVKSRKSSKDDHSESRVASLDRKILKILPGKQNITPVPTSHFRSYRKLPQMEKSPPSAPQNNLVNDQQTENVPLSPPIPTASPSRPADMADYRLATLAKCGNNQRQQETSPAGGYMTLEAFMLSRQEEERRHQSHQQPHITNILRVPQCHAPPPPAPSSSLIATAAIGHEHSSQFNNTSSAHFQTSDNPSKKSWGEFSSNKKSVTDHRTTSLKKSAQYQPPPRELSSYNQNEESRFHPAFEMTLDHASDLPSSSKTKKSDDTSGFSTSRLKNLFGSGKNDGQKNNLLAGSPRLRRVLFGDKKPQSRQSPVLQQIENTFEPIPQNYNTEFASPSLTVPLPERVTAHTPDYPDLEYPPVFEPESYSLSDVSSLLRSRTLRNFQHMEESGQVLATEVLPESRPNQTTSNQENSQHDDCSDDRY